MPPQHEGEEAQIEAVRVDGGQAPEGTDEFQVELPAQGPMPQAQAIIGVAASAARPVVVPASVVLPRDGVNYVVVMSPRHQVSAGSQPSRNQQVRLLWRPVEVTRQTAFDVELRAGVRDGEELVNQPALLLSQWKPEDKKPLPVVIDASD